MTVIRLEQLNSVEDLKKYEYDYLLNYPEDEVLGLYYPVDEDDIELTTESRSVTVAITIDDRLFPSRTDAHVGVDGNLYLTWEEFEALT